MRKHIVLALLVPILALTLISCDASMRTSFANFLGGLGGNVYIDSGLVEANKEDVKAAVATIAGLGSEGSTDTVSGGSTSAMGLAVTGLDPTVTTVMIPQGDADQKKLKDDLSNTLNSTQQTQDFKDEMKEPVSDPDRIAAVEGTVAVINATVDALLVELDKVADVDDAIKDALGNLKLDYTDGGDLTEGDVLLVQLMTNLISNTISTLDSIKGDGDLGSGLDSHKDDLLPIINDALFTAQIAEELAGSASIDFSGQLKFEDFFDEFFKGIRASRDGGSDDFDITPFIGSINNLGPELVKMFGLKKIDGSYGWKIGGYRKFISTQQAYRGALEHALTFAGKGDYLGNKLKNRGLVFDGSTAIKYLLAVIVTEGNEWNPVGIKKIISALIDANDWIATGTATSNTKWTDPDIDDELEDFSQYLYDNGTNADDEDYDEIVKVRRIHLKNILQNAMKLNDVAGIGDLTEAIDEFLKDDSESGFDAWFDDLDTTEKEGED